MSTSCADLDLPECILLNLNAKLGQRRNNLTTASATTRNHEIIEVSLCPARPPLPSNLYVHCPELRLVATPRLIRVHENHFLLGVAVDCSPDGLFRRDEADYFVYRAGTERPPSLQRLDRPHPILHDKIVGLLSRGANYTVATLVKGSPDHDIHIYHSENPVEWIHRKVSVTEPLRKCPVLIPKKCRRLLYHETSTVISIGGEAGTMGWVDLWHGILLCDVLGDELTLRAVPVPIPVDRVTYDNGRGTELGSPIPYRGIAFFKGGGDNPRDCLKLVHIEIDGIFLLPDDDETRSLPLSYDTHDWTIVTYTNTALTGFWEDWRMDCIVQASDMTIDPQIKSEFLQSGLLGSASGQALHNLLVSHPFPDVSAAGHEGVVYLMARKKYEHPEVWVLAIDTRNKTLLGAAQFDKETEWQPSDYAKYYPSGIAKYIKPDQDYEKRKMIKSIFGKR